MKIINLEEAISLLNANDVVAIPTETVYGLAGKIDSEAALSKIFKTKERPLFDPLIVHVSNLQMAKDQVETWPEAADVLAHAFWPGPLTIILKKNKNISNLITADSDFVAVRMPCHTLTLNLIQKLGVPLAAPSANKFKKTSPTSAEHVYDEFQDEVSILDGGRTDVGIESTVIQIFENEIVIYRPGKITAKDIKKVFEKNHITINVRYGNSPISPGQMNEHYKPNLPLILLDITKPQDEITRQLESTGFDLSKIEHFKLPSSAEIASRILYLKMRELSCDGGDALAFYLPMGAIYDEKWYGVINRLTKAASYNFFTL